MVLKKSESMEQTGRCGVVAGEMCHRRPDCSNKVLVVPKGEGCRCVTSEPEVTHLFPTLRTMQKRALEKDTEKPTVFCASKNVLSLMNDGDEYAKSASFLPRSIVKPAKTREQMETGVVRAQWNMSRNSGSDDRLTKALIFNQNYLDLVKTLLSKENRSVHRLVQPSEKFVPENWGVPSYDRRSPVLSM